MANTKTVKLIDRAYSALDHLNDVSHYSYRDRIYDLAAAGERGHRRGQAKGSYKCSVDTAAKMHVVRWLVVYATYQRELPTIADLLTVRDDAALAAMVVANYRDAILKALEGIDVEQLCALDYVALVEGRADDAIRNATASEG
jgi:hypothetical protein